MSFTFRIPHRDPPRRALFQNVGLPGLAWVTPPEEELLSPGTYHLHIEGRSTRGVEVTWEDGVLEVRILLGSSPEDYALSRAITTAAARQRGARIKPEQGPSVTADELEVTFGARWSTQMVEWGARTLRQSVFEHGTLTLIGPHRPFMMGYRIVRALDDAGPEETFSERLLDAIRRVQYPPAGYQAPDATEIALADGRRVTAVLWKLDQGTLLPPVDYVHLHALDGRPLLLRSEALLELPGVRATWADDRRLFVEPVPIEARAAVWGQVLQYDVRPTGELPN